MGAPSSSSQTLQLVLTDDDAVQTQPWVTVRLAQPVPAAPQLLQRWVEELRVQADIGLQIRVVRTADLRPQVSAPTAVDPRTGGILSLSLGELSRPLRDPWGPRGALRQLSRLLIALLPHARSLVLNLAGNREIEASAFATQLGDIDDPACIPFGAFVTSHVERGAMPRVRTLGMRTFGLPDVYSRVDPDDRWQTDRRFEAITLACHRMVRLGKALEDGSILRVPVGARIGAYPFDEEAGDLERYGVQTQGEEICVAPLGGSVDPVAAWKSGDIAPNTYRMLLRARVEDQWGTELVRDYPCENPRRIPHVVEIWSRPEGGWFVMTNGMGRSVQEAAKRGARRVELMLRTDVVAFRMVQVLGALALGFEQRAPAGPPWKVGDTVTWKVDGTDIAGFVLADGGTVQMPSELPVQMLLLLPLTAPEYAQARRGTAAFRERLKGDPALEAKLHARWHQLLSAEA